LSLPRDRRRRNLPRGHRRQTRLGSKAHARSRSTGSRRRCGCLSAL